MLTVILLAVSANIDNFTVAMAYGLKHSKISWPYNLLISVVTGLGTYLAMSGGQLVAGWLTSEIASIIGALMLMGIGSWFWIDGWRYSKRSHSRGREIRYLKYIGNFERGEAPICFREALLLALMLSINNLGSGIGVSMLGISAGVTAVNVGLLSVMAIFLGQGLARCSAAQMLSRYSAWIAGGILFLLGLSEMLWS